MTLIIKELIIKGIVTNESSKNGEDTFDKEVLMRYLDQMQKLIKKDCVEEVLLKLESKKIR